MERTHTTWKVAHLTNEEQGEPMQVGRRRHDMWRIWTEMQPGKKGKFQMQRKWKQQSNLGKVVKPAQKTHSRP